MNTDNANRAFYKRLQTAAENYAHANDDYSKSFYHGEMCGIINGAYMVEAIDTDEFNRGFELIAALTDAF